eukprot:RCo012446
MEAPMGGPQPPPSPHPHAVSTDALVAAIQKVETLRSAGVLTEQEYAMYRKLLLDDFIGIPMLLGPALPAGSPAAPLPPSTSSPNSEGPLGPTVVRSTATFPLPEPPFGTSQACSSSVTGSGTGSGTGAETLGITAQPPSLFYVKVQPIRKGTTARELSSALSKFGRVLSATVHSGNPAYGYVRFSSEAEAHAADAAGSVMVGEVLAKLRLGKRRERECATESAPSNGLGLFNLPYDTTADELLQRLAPAPGFLSVHMICRDDGKFRGYAFAYFTGIPEAVRCREQLQGLTIRGRCVDVKFAAQPSLLPMGS